MPQFKAKFDSIPLTEKLLVFFGGFGLTFIAGYINIIAIRMLDIPVSHMSGAISRLSFDLASNETSDLFNILMIILGFFFGAIFSGVVIGNSDLKPGRRYGIVLMIEGAILLIATYLMNQNNSLGIIFASTACGIQNALATGYYGLVIRTTHVTGIVTDLGILIGHWIKYRTIHIWKLMLLFILLLGFTLGGYAGWSLFNKFGLIILYHISLLTFLVGFIYFLWRNFSKKLI